MLKCRQGPRVPRESRRRPFRLRWMSGGRFHTRELELRDTYSIPNLPTYTPKIPPPGRPQASRHLCQACLECRWVRCKRANLPTSLRSPSRPAAHLHRLCMPEGSDRTSHPLSSDSRYYDCHKLWLRLRLRLRASWSALPVALCVKLATTRWKRVVCSQVKYKCPTTSPVATAQFHCRVRHGKLVRHGEPLERSSLTGRACVHCRPDPHLIPTY